MQNGAQPVNAGKSISRLEARREKLLVTVERTRRRFEKYDKGAKRALKDIAKHERAVRRIDKRIAKAKTEAADDVVESVVIKNPPPPIPTPEERIADLIARPSVEVDPTTQLGLLGPAPGFNSRGERVPDEEPAKPKRQRKPKAEPVVSDEAIKAELQKANNRLASAFNASMRGKGPFKAVGGEPSSDQVASEREKRMEAAGFRKYKRSK